MQQYIDLFRQYVNLIQQHPVIAGIAVLVILFIVLRLFRGRRDPLPERDPKCIWHTVVKELDRVYDGDTFYAHIKGHQPIDKKPVGIRIRGVDTPEMTDSHPAVKKKAEKAKAFVEEELRNAGTVHLYNVNMNDKYGRVLATVFCDRRDLGKMLLEKRLGKAYDGGKKEKW